MTDDDFAVEDILVEKKARIKSGQKGKRAERELVHILNKRFQELLLAHPDWGTFSRSIGSGNRWGQGVSLSHSATNTFSGDLCCPTNFKFVIESKSGYNQIDLCCAFDGGCKELDDFLSQVTSDSERCKREPILIWKKDHKPRLAFLKSTLQTNYALKYRDWNGYLLTDVLMLPDSFFFNLA